MKHESTLWRGWWIVALPLSAFDTGAWEPTLLAAALLIAIEVAALLRSDAALDLVEVQARMLWVLLLLVGSVLPLGMLELSLALIAASRLLLDRCPLAMMLRRMPWNGTLPGSATVLGDAR